MRSAAFLGILLLLAAFPARATESSFAVSADQPLGISLVIDAGDGDIAFDITFEGSGTLYWFEAWDGEGFPGLTGISGGGSWSSERSCHADECPRTIDFVFAASAGGERIRFAATPTGGAALSGFATTHAGLLSLNHESGIAIQQAGLQIAKDDVASARIDMANGLVGFARYTAGLGDSHEFSMRGPVTPDRGFLFGGQPGTYEFELRGATSAGIMGRLTILFADLPQS